MQRPGPQAVRVLVHEGTSEKVFDVRVRRAARSCLQELRVKVDEQGSPTHYFTLPLVQVAQGTLDNSRERPAEFFCPRGLRLRHRLQVLPDRKV